MKVFEGGSDPSTQLLHNPVPQTSVYLLPWCFSVSPHLQLQRVLWLGQANPPKAPLPLSLGAFWTMRQSTAGAEMEKTYGFSNVSFVPGVLKSHLNMLYLSSPLIRVSVSSAASPLVWNGLFGENRRGHLETRATWAALWFLKHVLIDANYMVYCIICCFCLLLEKKILT